jgi:hypothetical protein
MRFRGALITLMLALALAPTRAHAQQAAAAPPPAAPQADPDRALVPAEPDFTLATLPTSLRVPRGGFVFRLTHRFTRPITEGSAGDFFANFFNLDSSAIVGLELRAGLGARTQVVAHRTSDRTVQIAGQYQGLSQQDGDDLSVDALVALEGRNNFSEAFGGTIGAIVSRHLGTQAAVYAHPLIVFNTTDDPIAKGGDDRTVLLGLGARVRLGQTRVYVLIEAAPRLSGVETGVAHVSVAVEKRAGGHVFQINVSNGLGSTLRQIALGGPAPREWFLGFNLTRKFF